MKNMLLVALPLLLAVSCNSTGGAGAKIIYKQSAGDGVVAKFAGANITEKEVAEGQESEIYESEKKIYDLKMSKIKTLVMKKLIAADDKSKGLSEEEFIAKFIESKIEISDKDVEKFIKEKNIPQEHINPTIKDRIKSYLKVEKRNEAMEKWLTEKTKSNPIEVMLAKPQLPTFDVKVGNAPVWGDAGAKVTIVEFSDFQCPFCAKGAELMNQIKKAYKGKVRIAFKHFPLPFHADAEPASVASMCVHEQKADKFWDYHDKLFANQTALKVDGLTKMAQDVGVDVKKFTECFTANKFQQFVRNEVEEGKVVGVKSTPTFYVNGKLINGAQPFEVFKEIIDEELAK